MAIYLQIYLLQIFLQHFICIARVKSLQSSCLFQTLFQTPIIEMFSLNRNQKVTCENCGTQTTKLNLARHKKSCSAGTLYCTQCPNFSTKYQNDLKYHIARSTAPQNLILPSSVNFAFKGFRDFTLCVNIETLNTQCRSDREQEF